MERERLSQMTDKDKLNEAVKAADQLRGKTSKPQPNKAYMQDYREGMERLMDDALSGAEEIRKQREQD